MGNWSALQNERMIWQEGMGLYECRIGQVGMGLGLYECRIGQVGMRFGDFGKY